MLDTGTPKTGGNAIYWPFMSDRGMGSGWENTPLISSRLNPCVLPETTNKGMRNWFDPGIFAIRKLELVKFRIRANG